MPKSFINQSYWVIQYHPYHQLGYLHLLLPLHTNPLPLSHCNASRD